MNRIPKLCENCAWCEEVYEEGHQFYQCIRVMKETGAHDTCDNFRYRGIGEYNE